MSNFTLDSETYAWLNSLKLLPPPAQNAKGFAFNVPSNIAPAFESGQMVARLVNMIAGKSVIQIDSLKYSLGKKFWFIVIQVLLPNYRIGILFLMD